MVMQWWNIEGRQNSIPTLVIILAWLVLVVLCTLNVPSGDEFLTTPLYTYIHCPLWVAPDQFFSVSITVSQLTINLFINVFSSAWREKVLSEQKFREEGIARLAGGLTYNPTREIHESTNLTSLIRTHTKSRNSLPLEICQWLPSEVTESRYKVADLSILRAIIQVVCNDPQVRIL